MPTTKTATTLPASKMTDRETENEGNMMPSDSTQLCTPCWTT